MLFGFGKRSGVAVVEVHGAIGTRVKVSVYSRIFDAIARNNRFRALLLDLDSPGGSASGSETLYYSLRKVAQRKPVVAYVRNMGASGGYYLCCAASRVVALPTALVGSIGVIYLRPIMEQLLGKVGMEFTVFKGGHLKDMTGFWRGPTGEEEEKFQGLINEIYDNFVSVVAQGRRLDEAKVKELATGEVFTARRGKELGLVDELGDFEQAMLLAGQLGETRPRLMWVRPKRSLSERLLGLPANQATGAGLLAAEAQRLLTGGIYYLEPSHLLGEYGRE